MLSLRENFDIEFLSINQLSYVFNKFCESTNSSQYTSFCIHIASKCLHLMNRYGALHPSHEKLIDYLKKHGQQNIYDRQWCSTIQQRSCEFQETLNTKFDTILASSNASSSPSDNQQLFSEVRQGVVIAIIETNYQNALSFLNKYSTVVQFYTQPRSLAQLKENRFIEYLFFQYIVSIFDLIWFPLDSLQQQQFTFTRRDDSTSGGFKNLDSIAKKVNNYYTKCEMLLSSSVPEEEEIEHISDELFYFWLVKFYGLTVLFKQFKFLEFHEEFDVLFVKYQTINAQIEASPLLLLSDNLPILRSNILSMYGIVMIFLKPFNSLSLMDVGNDDALLDLFSAEEDKFEYLLYHEVMVPLSESNNRKAKMNFLENSRFSDMFVACLDYLAPAVPKSSTSASINFIRYLNLIIDFKNFLLILSVVKQAPRLKMIELLGYDIRTMSDSSLSATTHNILSLMGALGLGKIGVGYRSHQDVFFNEGHDSKLAVRELQSRMDELTNDLQAESIAITMTGALLEKFFS
ncbi:predicted protein [Scheffersomyces stipitis CBS 6054]|uniref:Uncharacterized protein n=1 Tax=Scheffersomyces stipitis (strain ATCC 58785 / CBS 6054 / NBRC 10063 / NRRL Y-11545) TaxID=322104 RepID=A3LPU7_PICST|nr:predicted protein [Scheffersomyces stipitis CBS 6054]ABN64561.2 predicted protein [Scheffersomyces stipitis CBS 6054]KAG2736513.1 hypothetical protein G9P44_000603 [Scheffersomyces stipitis]